MKPLEKSSMIFTNDFYIYCNTFIVALTQNACNEHKFKMLELFTHKLKQDQNNGFLLPNLPLF